jgi:hypothetical protein
MPSITLPVRTARLTLRDFTPGDFDAIHAYASDPDVTRGASARVLAKAGLVRVATLERHKYALGKWWTSFLYGRRREAWPCSRRPEHSCRLLERSFGCMLPASEHHRSHPIQEERRCLP